MIDAAHHVSQVLLLFSRPHESGGGQEFDCHDFLVGLFLQPFGAPLQLLSEKALLRGRLPWEELV